MLFLTTLAAVAAAAAGDRVLCVPPPDALDYKYGQVDASECVNALFYNNVRRGRGQGALRVGVFAALTPTTPAAQLHRESPDLAILDSHS